jgi:hypothetical protein
MPRTTYRNPWHHSGHLDSPEFFSTDKPALLWEGCEIFHVLPEQWDVVKSGTCITQRAGLKGAKQAAEVVADLPMPSYLDVQERMLEKYGRI